MLDTFLRGSGRTLSAGGLVWGVVRAFRSEGKTGEGNSIILGRNEVTVVNIATDTGLQHPKQVLYTSRRHRTNTFAPKIGRKSCCGGGIVLIEDRADSANTVMEASLQSTPQIFCTSSRLKPSSFTPTIERKNHSGERIVLVKDRMGSANAETTVANASGRVLRRVQVALGAVVLAHVTHSIIVWAVLSGVLKLKDSNKAPLAPGSGPGMNESQDVEIARAVAEKAQEGTRRS